ncbi:MAG: hypothetical protein Q9190_005974, partial [Brigantiaea leucoxantha]
SLIIFDTLHPLALNPKVNLPAFLSSLLSLETSLLAIYHLDIPLHRHRDLYAPHPLTLLKYLATTILTTRSLPQMVSRKRALNRSLAEPGFGLAEDREGIVIGSGANDSSVGVVLEMEYRRKSGREVTETFFLPSKVDEETVPLEKFKGCRSPQRSFDENSVSIEGNEVGGVQQGGTFELGLTEKQRRARQEVILPYLDAQKEDGGEGGRILYNLGVEDDFDEEEDEI